MNATTVLVLLGVMTAFALITVVIPTRSSFIPAAVSLIVSALFIGFVNVGLLYTFGIPLIPLPISAVALWRSQASLRIKAIAILISILALPGGFALFLISLD